MAARDAASCAAQLGAVPPHAGDELWGLTRADVEALTEKLPKCRTWLQKRWYKAIAATDAGEEALEAAEVEYPNELWDVDEDTAHALSSTLGDAQRAAWLLGFLGFGGPSVVTDDALVVSTYATLLPRTLL